MVVPILPTQSGTGGKEFMSLAAVVNPEFQKVFSSRTNAAIISGTWW
jgi:hypothetical protein